MKGTNFLVLVCLACVSVYGNTLSRVNRYSKLYNDREPPEIPDEEFNVCEDPDFKCKWVTEDGEVLDEVTEEQRETCLEVAATVRVSDEVHMTAVDIVRLMLRHAPFEVFQALVPHSKAGTFIKADKPTIFPEYAHLRDTPECEGRCDNECSFTCIDDERKYDDLAGIGDIRGTQVLDNVMCTAEDPYDWEDNGLVHEFSHTIHQYALPYVEGNWWYKILDAYDSAWEDEIWDRDSYAMLNHLEYFAKGSGVFFNTIHANITGGMNSCGKPDGFCDCPEDGRAWLEEQDPLLYEALVFTYATGDSTAKGDLHICMTDPNNVECEA